MSKLTLENVTKTYANGYKAVKSINLNVQDQEFLVLVGPSGCGKSTILRMIAGLEEISDGKIYLDGNALNDVEPKNRDIAMVFQNYALYPHKTVFDNMAFGLKMRKVPKKIIKDKVEEVASTLGISELLKSKPKNLSGGQRQRVALGRAIVRQPQIFLMDEPLSNLDAKLRAHMRAEISRLHSKLKTTFIYVTHDQIEAMTMGTRIVVMKDGIIQQIDNPQNIYYHPANTFVATFIGSPRINLMECIIKEENDIVYADFNGFNIKLSESHKKLVKEKNYVGKNIIVGVRPESIRVLREKDNIDNYLKCSIEVKEMLGSEMYLYLNKNGEEIIVRTEADLPCNIGEEARIVLDENKIHLFDKETGKTLIE